MTGDGDCCRNETKGKVCDHETTVTDAKDARRESNRRAFVRSRTSTGVKHTTVELKRCQNTSYNVVSENE